jgi:lysophospholipase L1-like esterase
MIKTKQHRDLVLSAIAVGLSAATVLTCSAIGGRKAAYGPERAATSVAETRQPPIPTPTASTSAAPDVEEAPGSSVGLWAGADALGLSEEGNAIPRLPRFYGSLARLASGLRHDHVRIVWLGDSHTQADVWTHAVRSKLQEEFGNGGPGFIHIGWDTYGYRHEYVGLRVSGGWSIRPVTLVSVTQVEDGVFGLGGVRLVARGLDSMASLIVSPKGLPGKGLWDLAYRFTSEDGKLVVKINGSERRLEANARSLGRIQHEQFETSGPGGTLAVEQAWGKPELFGAVVESAEKHGVVLDSLGLNGARVRSALAWDETTWVSELARREPDLVVLAFGTNESSNVKLKGELHTERVKKLLARVRKAAPNTDCLIFGPIDRGGEQYSDVVERINEAQKAAATELGCAFWNGQKAMGGKGSMQRWAMMSPPLGGGDRVHLYPRGYQKLGRMLARDLLVGYHAGVPAE